MTERRGDQGFAVVTRSVTRGSPRGRGPRRPQRLGVVLVAVVSIGLVAAGFLGPRLSSPPSLDLSYFATPTPLPTPEPTYPRPAATPLVTPLPVVTHADGVTLQGTLAISGDAFRYLDLATGTTRRILDVQLWRDALLRTGDDQFVCICFVDDYDVTSGPFRSIDLVTIVGEQVTKTTLDRLHPSAASSADQPDPFLDVAVDRDHRTGVLGVALRTKAGWDVGVRPLDISRARLGIQTAVGRIALPPLPPGVTPTPVPSDQPFQENLYFDGPHIRLAPDARTAIVWAAAQRYSDTSDPTTTQGAWRVRFAADGSVEAVAELGDFVRSPQFCPGVAFAGTDRLIGLCTDPTATSSSGAPVWLLRTFDAAGVLQTEYHLPDPGDFGYNEPLVDVANHRVYLWDSIGLRLVRVDLDAGAIVSTTFDPAASTAAGVTSGSAPLAPEWHDGDSAVQQTLFASLAGSADGRHLYAVGMRPNPSSNTYGVAALGVFVIDPATLALEARWAPAADDIWVATLPDGRVATGAQPGMDAEGHETSWEGSLTIRDPSDGRILARYGRVSTDQPPVLIGP